MQSVKGKDGRHDDTLGKNSKSIRPVDKIYRPTDREPFMNERQREYFRLKLLDWREDILNVARETLQNLQDSNQNHPDLADRASSETDRAIELRAGDRQRKLIAKIDAALQRIENGAYGYCEETGEPISLKRLEARPIATLSIEAQETTRTPRARLPRRVVF
jgi:DnaK suppressor protein